MAMTAWREEMEAVGQAGIALARGIAGKASVVAEKASVAEEQKADRNGRMEVSADNVSTIRRNNANR